MIDPLLSLAFSVYSNKGAYALLLGSGASRGAEIPTGWEVVLDLIRKLAKLQGENCEPEPEKWFRLKHETEPDYSKLLDALCKTPAERQQLLRGYFEPTEEEQNQGRKVPTTAHKVIAQLVAAGYVRVIVTTNFDRLIERALEQVGVAPSVISVPDAAKGALPLAHSKATVVKLHGDYLDVRIKNTPAELAEYDTGINELLDQILDEYGLIVSGWSGDWDTALRAAILRCPSRRFTTFWTTLSTPSEQAKRLVDFRAAQVVQIKDSAEFFEALHQRIQALEEFTVSHPLSARIASVTVKRHLTDPPPHIRLNDLVHAETERAYAEMIEKNFPLSAFEPQLEDEWVRTALQQGWFPEGPVSFWHRRFHDEIVARARKYEALLEVLLSAVMTGIQWGGPRHAGLWGRCIERLGNPRGLEGLPINPPSFNPSSNDGLFSAAVPATSIPVARALSIQMELYPALLITWGAGLAATAANDALALAAILKKPRLFLGTRWFPLLSSLPFQSVSFEQTLGPYDKPYYAEDNRFAGRTDFWGHLDPSLAHRLHEPLSLHLRHFFRERMREWLPIDSVYHECFDRFEHLMVALRSYLYNRPGDCSGSPFPWGGQDWSLSGYDHKGHLWATLQSELNPQLRFDGSREPSALRTNLFEEVQENQPIYCEPLTSPGEKFPRGYREIPGWYSLS